MKITEVKTAFKIADVSWGADSTKLKFNYLKDLKDENGNPLPQSILKENVCRVYLIVVDDEIMKIGCSEDKGGIKGTLYIYQTGGIKGRPSTRSVGIWHFLLQTIQQNKKIEFYMIHQPNVTAKVKGLLGEKEINNAILSAKTLEDQCLQDYRSHENGNYPKWNVQEQAGDWPDEIKQIHAKIMAESAARRTASGRKKVSM